jgi:hypothetical protein
MTETLANNGLGIHMLSTKRISTVLLSMALGACGGGSGNQIISPIADNQAVGGFWTTQYTVASGENMGDVIDSEAIVSDTGEYFLYSKNTTNGCAGLGFGQLSAAGNAVTGTVDFATVQYTTIPGIVTNCVYPDGSTSGTGTVTGDVTQQSSLTITESGTTSMGTALPAATTTWAFSNLYLNPSSLATISGNYNDGGATLTIDTNGVIVEQDADGCEINGQISIINSSYNVYGVQFTFSNCTGTDASLNGVSASGLVMLDTSTSPVTLVGGVNGTVDGEFFAEAFELPMM